MPKIFTLDDKREAKFLRKKTVSFTFSTDRRKVKELIEEMKRVMGEANGIGLSANQIGLGQKVFVAEVPNQKGSTKFYAIFNPEIQKVSKEKETLEEGCLSIPGVYGQVPRAEKITISGLDKNGRRVKIKAWGLLSRVFQHEVDHLNGVLFVDKATSLIKDHEKWHAARRAGKHP